MVLKEGETNEEKMKDTNEEKEKEGEVDEETAKNERHVRKNDELKPLDGGYGWFVVLGLFMAMLLSGGLSKGAGLFFLQFQEHFHKSALLASWPGSIMSTIQDLIGPFVSALCNRWSVRTSVMIGSFSMFLGLTLHCATKNFYFLFFCHSLLLGVGAGCLINPGLFTVSSYFEKRRSFAVSLATAGSGFGTFIIVPLINFFFEFYGFDGAFFVLAAVFSHGFVIAFLYRPLSMHHRFTMTRKTRADIDMVCQVVPVESQLHKDENGDLSCVPLKQSTDNPDLIIKQDQPSFLDTQQSKKQAKSCSELRSSFKICFPTEHNRKGNSRNRKIFHFNLLRDASFLFHLVSTVFFSMTIKGMFMFIPALCLEKGLTKTEASLMLSISGAVDTLARIGYGYLFDHPKLRNLRPTFFTGFPFVLAVAGSLLPILEGFVPITCMFTVVSVCFAIFVTQRVVILVDMMGKELLPSCMGLLRLFQASGMFLGPLLFGATRDATDSYHIAFYMGGGIMSVAGLLLLISNILWRLQQRKKKRQMESKAEEA